MAKTEIRTRPDHETKGWPPGVPYIIGNEGCERFSFYGMRSILTLYMADVLYKNHPLFQSAPNDFAKAHYHLFVAAVYAVPMVGAIVADRLLGKYSTIFWLSLVYTAGHGVLALAEKSVWGLWIGLGLIALGSGGIKPCVSANVGDQFGQSNWFRVRTVYQAFYFIINFGSFFATLLIPWLWKRFGASVAFGTPGVLMAIATVVFWMGRKKFVHVPAKPGGILGVLDTLSSTFLFLSVGHLFFYSAGERWYLNVAIGVVCIAIGGALFAARQRREQDDGFLAVLYFCSRNLFVREREADDKQTPAIEAPNAEVRQRREKLVKSRFFGPAVRHFGIEAAEGPLAVLLIMSVFFLVSVFWALFDQHGSSWVLQAKQMELEISVPFYRTIHVEPAQVAALNPLIVMLLIPLVNYVIYPGVEKLGFKATPLRRMTAGMLVTSFSFVAVALIQRQIDRVGNGIVPIEWQLVPYVILTLGEVLVSVTGLEFAYTQAPKRMKSTIMGFWLLTVTVGNVLVSIISKIKLPPEPFFWVFAGLMAGAGLLFGLRAYFYRQQDYIQD